MSSLEKSNKKTETLLELTAQSQYNNRLVVKNYGNMNIHKALSSSSKSVGLIAKTDESKAIQCISNLFKATALYFDTSLSQNKAELISTEILSKYEYRNLKLEDILAICIRIKESDTFKLTVARILKEIKKYSKEREILAIEKSRHKAESQKSSINSSLEERLKKHFKTLPNTDRIATKRNVVKSKFK